MLTFRGDRGACDGGSARTGIAGLVARDAGAEQAECEVARRAHALGIPFVTGTDLMGRAAVDAAAAVHDELELLVTRAGHSPAEAIRAATLHGARAARAEQQQGTIEVGTLADVVVLSADPLTDIRNTRRIACIVKGGELHEPALSKQILQRAANRASRDTTVVSRDTTLVWRESWPGTQIAIVNSDLSAGL